MAPARKLAKKRKRGLKRVVKPPTEADLQKAANARAAAEKQTPRAKVAYTFDLSERICERLANGETGTAVCRDAGMPSWDLLQSWLRTKPDFQRRYERARESGYEYWADDTLDIADTPQPGNVTTTQEWGTQIKRADMLEHRRLRIDARKWLLCKRARHIYGDKNEVDVRTPDGINVKVEERNALIDAIVKLVSPKEDGKTKPSGRSEEARER